MISRPKGDTKNIPIAPNTKFHLIKKRNLFSILPFLSFAVENMPCGSSGVTCTKSISITINGMTMKYVRGESIRRVNALEYESNGVVVDNIGGEFMTVIWKGMGLILKFDAGKNVQKC
jgi:hypothetical protein